MALMTIRLFAGSKGIVVTVLFSTVRGRTCGTEPGVWVCARKIEAIRRAARSIELRFHKLPAIVNRSVACFVDPAVCLLPGAPLLTRGLLTLSPAYCLLPTAYCLLPRGRTQLVNCARLPAITPDHSDY